MWYDTKAFPHMRNTISSSWDCLDEYKLSNYSALAWWRFFQHETGDFEYAISWIEFTALVKEIECVFNICLGESEVSIISKE
jgi:hypothetical protein